MRRINFFSLIALFIFFMNSGDVIGAEVCKNEMQTIKIFNRSSYEIFVYFNKEDAKNNQNYKFSVPKMKTIQLDFPSSDFSKIYLKRKDHNVYCSAYIPSVCIWNSSNDLHCPFGMSMYHNW